MSELVQIKSDEGQPAGGQGRFSPLVHAFRLALFVSVVVCLRQSYVQMQAAASAKRAAAAIDVSTFRDLLPTAKNVAKSLGKGGQLDLLDESGEVVGAVMRSSPESDAVIGFSGPTTTWIVFGPDRRIIGIEIADSGDTREHVSDVRRDPNFLSSLNGKSINEALLSAGQIDGVSGATLTSLALLEGVLRRLERVSTEKPAGTPRSLKFPQPIQLSEVVEHYPTAKMLEARERFPQIFDVLDQQRQRLGAVFRTAPAGDQTVGYQGPTDTLVLLDENDGVKRVQVRKSFDNKQYVDYVREDDYFARVLAEKKLDSLASLDLFEERIEGVSGATMTSMAIMETIPLATKRVLKPVEPPVVVQPRTAFRFEARDWGTVVVMCGAFLLAFTRLRGNRWVRWGFQLVLVGYLGFLNGDMLSQAQLIGWAKSGAPWQFAPGLTILTIAAFASPILTKRQVYCQQICPFGAAQQVAHQPGKRWTFRRGQRVLKSIPFLLVVFCVVVGLLGVPFELAAIEPFDAFLFGSVGSIVIAVLGLALSFRVPMAYCRYGCPTGAVLDYVRYHRRADRLGWRDALTLGLLIFGLLSLWLGAA